MKLLLYCTKAKPYLLNQNVYEFYDSKYITSNLKCHEKYDYTLNGKIVAECDYEVEEIYCERLSTGVGYEPCYYLENGDVFYKESCLTPYELENYLGFNGTAEQVGYAIHIKNLHIFDTPKRTSTYNTYNKNGKVHIANIPIYTAPQNMMYAFDYYGNLYVLISIKPKDLCKILNGEKTIEVRKKVLKEMLKNE